MRTPRNGTEKGSNAIVYAVIHELVEISSSSDDAGLDPFVWREGAVGPTGIRVNLS